MITAKEARERSNTLKVDRINQQEQEEIEKGVNRAVETGRSHCWFDYYISKATEDWLKSLGYIVEYSHSQTYRGTKVSW